MLSEAEAARAKQLRAKALTAVQCNPRYSHLKVAAAKRAATIVHAEMWTEARTFDHSSNSQQTYYWNKGTRETRWVRCFFLHTGSGACLWRVYEYAVLF